MKKYFVIAALLGVFAFASVSLLAHAEHTGNNVKLAAAVTDRDQSGPAEDDASDGEAASDEAAAADDGADAGGDAGDGGAATGPRNKMDAYDDASDECTSSSQDIKGRNGGEATESEIKKAYDTCMKTNGYNKVLIEKMEKEKEKDQ